MDEQHSQAYVNLIEQLLICADDEERVKIYSEEKFPFTTNNVRIS